MRLRKAVGICLIALWVGQSHSANPSMAPDESWMRELPSWMQLRLRSAHPKLLEDLNFRKLALGRWNELGPLRVFGFVGSQTHMLSELMKTLALRLFELKIHHENFKGAFYEVLFATHFRDPNEQFVLICDQSVACSAGILQSMKDILLVHRKSMIVLYTMPSTIRNELSEDNVGAGLMGIHRFIQVPAIDNGNHARAKWEALELSLGRKLLAGELDVILQQHKAETLECAHALAREKTK